MQTSVFCLVLSTFLNILLLFLLTKTKKQIGSYRYFLTLYSCFLMSFNFLDFLMFPAVHIYKNGFIYFATSNLRYRPFGIILAGLQSWSQGLYMTLLSINFVYRYSIIHNYGCGMYWYIWPIVAAGLMFVWGCADIFLVLPCDLFDWYFSVLEKYGIDILESGYYAITYFVENAQTGKEEYYWPSIFRLGLFFVFQSITSFLIETCGYSLYKKVKDASNFSSGVMAKVHKDLFWTLVLQTITPCLMVYVPGFILVIAPFLDIDVNKIKIEEIQPLSISIFPIIDTCIILIFFRGFRVAFMKLLWKTPTTISNSVRLQHIT
ncbi:Protein CBG17498 [Caenorhabditis briggsae]|uniref:Protein CBG17498 n=3 Tax=Caenorhabditis briggsae TaxID=6238 RepID=A8XRB7_CAEBR|nr:Protein CBG17498 [Caenorhabditis briggsae]CAP35136.2 Protein CBG17498 [Caenorhabditis briggsae]